MYALRERRVHVTQEDFEMAVAKVSYSAAQFIHLILFKNVFLTGHLKLLLYDAELF